MVSTGLPGPGGYVRLHRGLEWSLAACLAAAAGLAAAQDAYSNRYANVRAGPDRGYPLVAQLAPGTPLQIMGCIDDWSWCDVAFDDSRGWVYAPFLSYVDDGGEVPFYAYAPTFGIPVVVFSLGSYWGDWYRGQPWYGDRDRWENRPPPHSRPPGPPPGTSRPPSPRPLTFTPHAPLPRVIVPRPAATPGAASPQRGAPQFESRAPAREPVPHREVRPTAPAAPAPSVPQPQVAPPAVRPQGPGPGQAFVPRGAAPPPGNAPARGPQREQGERRGAEEGERR